jgi:bifunctional non-homologous end joining protein LigD
MTRRIRPPSSKELLLEGEVPLRGGRRSPRDPDQPALPFDPPPGRIDPCLALLTARPPEGDDWAYEIKWDGWRLFIHKSGDDIRLITRGGHDWTSKFPAIAKAAAALPIGSIVLDGEAVVLDDMGRSDFSALSAIARKRRSSETDPVLHMAFDVLYFDGHDVSRMDQAERRQILEGVVSAEGTIRLSEEIEADGATAFRAACEHGLEGIVAKRRDAPYQGGRKGEWRKIKCVQRECFLIVGYRPSKSGFGGIGALILAARSGGRLKTVGTVSSGLDGRSGPILRKRLDGVTLERPSGASGTSVFVRPELVSLVEFRTWTAGGRLRHVVFKGVVEDALEEVFDLASLQPEDPSTERRDRLD